MNQLIVVVAFAFSTYVRTQLGASAFGEPTPKLLVCIHAAVTNGDITNIAVYPEWVDQNYGGHTLWFEFGLLF